MRHSTQRHMQNNLDSVQTFGGSVALDHNLLVHYHFIIHTVWLHKMLKICYEKKAIRGTVKFLYVLAQLQKKCTTLNKIYEVQLTK